MIHRYYLTIAWVLGGILAMIVLWGLGEWL
jgi:hypothetical protein